MFCPSLLILLVAGAQGGRPGENLSVSKMEHLILEAASFFDWSVSRRRVSEAKAISDLLRVAGSPDLGSICSAAKNLERSQSPGIDKGHLLSALAALQGLTFSSGSGDPESEEMPGVRVIAERIHLTRRSISEVMQSAEAEHLWPPRFSSHRNLMPFYRQVMTQAEYLADKRFQGETEATPALVVDQRTVAKLLPILDDARVRYAGLKGDNRRFVGDLIEIALCTDTSAIVEAGRKFGESHAYEDNAAAVLEPLEELIWGKSKVQGHADCTLREFTVNDGELALSTRYVYFYIGNGQWADRQAINACYWLRRNVAKFARQATTRVESVRQGDTRYP